MSKIDDLIAAYNAAYHSRHDEQHRAGIAAVVRALRDEMVAIWNMRGDPVELVDEIIGDAGNEKVAGVPTSDAGKATEAGGARCATTCASAPATDPIRNAVATARGRALAVDDIPTLNKLAAMMSPATDPAPAVCVWTQNARGWWVASCDKRYSFRKTARQKLTNCQVCNTPIKFTEAKA